MASHKHKISNFTLAMVAILAIVLITYFAIIFTPGTAVDTSQITTSSVNTDQSGYTTEAVLQEGTKATSCKLICGMTTLYDETTLAVTLGEGASTTYAGRTVSVSSINSNGCMIQVDYVKEYLALGQIQKVGTLYVTVTDVVG
jgi:hypothetical protein